MDLRFSQPAFRALIWNNEVSNKVTLCLCGVRPAVSGQRSSLAIEAGLTSGLTAIPQPAAMWMLQAHAARKALQVPVTSGEPLKKDW